MRLTHVITLMIGTALIVGCASAPAATTAPPVEAPVGEAPAETAASQPTGATPATALAQLSATAEPTAADAEMPPRPSEAAAIDADFRPDSYLQVAATGRPQLIEFFAFW